MFDRTKNFLTLMGASQRTVHALKSGAKPAKADLDILGIDAARIKNFR